MTYRNLAELHRRQARRLGPKPALRFKRDGLYHDLSWQEYRNEVAACAAALVDVGVRPGDRVGLLSENRVEWLIADVGLLAAGAVNVPPHAPLAARQVHFQLADAGVSWLFVSSAELLQKVREVRADLPELRGLVVFDRMAVEGDVWPWSGFLQRGRQALPRLAAELALREEALGPDDLATIMYTSGTTGSPKGVMLTHNNLMSNAAGCVEIAPPGPEGVMLSWLPYSHIYSRTVDHYQHLVAGNILALAECADAMVLNLAEVRPTLMTAVPRFYEKVLTTVGGQRLRAVFGPRMDWLSCGGAPLPRWVEEAYHAAGLALLPGYGLTESSPVVTFNRKTQHKFGTVGLPLPGVEVAIAPDGEVLTRGPHVMKGYWRNPQATAAAIRDGWLYTGDLGSLDADGFLTITGRKKELLVLSNGKKVVPSHLEGLLVADDCIDQAVVCGEGRNFLTALIVPNWEHIRRALTAEGADATGSEEGLAARSDVRALLRRRIDRALADLASWEQVGEFLVLSRPFTVASEELTVSLKLRRAVVLARHRAELEKLYRP